MDSSFVFSFIMAVYNTEMFVEEAIDSIINQSIGFEENIQLILINDGSTDGSLDILNKYQSMFPNNITVVNQENQGAAAARNAGFKYIKGNIVNFLDSDDYLSLNACEEVLKFFNLNYESVDLVALPVVFVGRINGQHPLNYKFEETRVIDLTEEPNNPQLHAASSFIKYDALGNIRFPDLLLSEDANFVNKIILKKKTLGAIAQAEYYYRKHDNFSSLLDNASSDERFFNDRLKNHFLALIDYCLEHEGYVPEFIQYMFVYDLHYLILSMDLEVYENHIDKEEFDSYLDKIFEYIDVDVIWYNQNITSDLLRKFLRYFKVKEMHVNPKEGTKLISGKKQIDKLSIHAFWLDIVEIKNGYFNISGYLNSLFNSDYISVSAVIESSDGNVEKIVAKRVFYTARKNKTFLSIDWQYNYNFDLNIPLKDFENPIIKLCVNYHIDGNVSNFDEKNVVSHFLKIGFKNHARISKISNYFVKENRIVYFENNEFNIIPYSYKSLVNREKIVRNLLNKEKPYKYPSMLRLRLCYLLLYPFMQNKKIFLFMDRIDKSDDNAEHLFKYALQQDDDIKKYFVLSKSSDDYSRVSKFGKVIGFNSFKHRLLYLFADKVISSHPDESVLNPFFPNAKNIDQRQYLNSLISSGTYFLQHGVAYGNFSKWLKKYDKNISLLLTSSNLEREEFCRWGYGYDENIIQVLGLPRFDNLKSNPKNKIIIIPTWRNYLGGKLLFKNSPYFKSLNDLMNDERLISLCDEHNYEIIFKPHPKLNTVISKEEGDEKYLDLFEFNDYINVSTEESYQDLFEKGSLLITDFSSVAFDFAYLKKPVIYYQPNDDYHHQKSYFDPETMGFGDVIKNESALLDKINFYLKNDCIMEDKYKDNVDKFFKYHDKHNCERVYDWIKKH